MTERLAATKNESTPLDIRLSKVEVSLPGGRILFKIPELHIPQGSHFLIQGESGLGKTTLLHLIAGLLPPTEGDVSIGDRSLKRMTDDERCEFRRARIGVIFQRLNLLDHLTVAENVSLTLPKGDSHAHEKISGALARVNMKGRESDLCSYLSLGEQQRVAVARVLAQEPDIVLADEPTSSLDDKNAGFIIEALKDASRDGTLIVVSHDHRIARSFDQTIAFAEFT